MILVLVVVVAILFFLGIFNFGASAPAQPIISDFSTSFPVTGAAANASLVEVQVQNNVGQSVSLDKVTVTVNGVQYGGLCTAGTLYPAGSAKCLISGNFTSPLTATTKIFYSLSSPSGGSVNGTSAGTIYFSALSSQVPITGFVTGGGYSGYLAEWTGTNSLGNGPIASSVLSGGGLSGYLAEWNSSKGLTTGPSCPSGDVLVSSGGGGFTCSAPSSSGAQIFTSNGTFTVPSGVTEVYITAVGGGGGGGGGASDTNAGLQGGNGSSSSFGNIVVCGGTGGLGGVWGEAVNTQQPLNNCVSGFIGATSKAGTYAGTGASSILGIPGGAGGYNCLAGNCTVGSPGVEFGTSGGGGGGSSCSSGVFESGGNGGNSGGFIVNYPVSVTPGAKISVTVGSGGSGGGVTPYGGCTGSDGGAGALGEVIVQWVG
jgi:hypothetical protein